MFSVHSVVMIRISSLVYRMSYFISSWPFVAIFFNSMGKNLPILRDIAGNAMRMIFRYSLCSRCTLWQNIKKIKIFLFFFVKSIDDIRIFNRMWIIRGQAEG